MAHVVRYYLKLGMYWGEIFKIQLEPDGTGYQTNYPARTRYLHTCSIANMLVFRVV